MTEKKKYQNTSSGKGLEKKGLQDFGKLKPKPVEPQQNQGNEGGAQQGGQDSSPSKK